MILFMNDWLKYPRAIVDTNTRNKSFLKIAKLYKDMGIKNYYFHLALLQPELQGVDPHDEDNLTLEQKTMILWEIDNNPWYYLREMILNKDAGFEIHEQMFVANRSNIAAMWLLCCSIDYIQIQPRQTGKSYGTDCNGTWLHYYVYEGTQMNLITKDDTLRQANIQRIKEIRDGIPDYCMRHSKKDDNNQISLSCVARNNKFISHVSQSSERGATNLGRGLTSPYVHVDEGPFIAHIELTISSAMGSMSTARENAARKGYPACTIFTTTAGNPATRDGKYMFDIWSNAAPWQEEFLDSRNRDELVKLIKANKHGMDVTVNLTLSATQLGKSKEWLLEAIGRARSEGSNIDRDYFNRWTSGSDEGLISGKDATAVRDSEMEPIRKVMSDNGFIWRWYEAYDPSEMYVLGLDTSDAIGRDDIALLLTNARTGATAASGWFNEINLINFGQWLVVFLIEYKNVLLIIERQYNAQVLIDFLIIKLLEAGEDPFKRMYNEIVQNRDADPDLYDKVIEPGLNRYSYHYDKYKSKFGFKTNKDTRGLLYGQVLFNTVENFADVIRDSKLISQMLSLVIKNNRVDHGSGAHDDMVIAWLLSHWLLNYGVDVSSYGLDPRSILSERKNKKEMNPAERVKHIQQNKIKNEIKELTEQLDGETSTMEILQIENKLRKLTRQVIDVDDDSVNIDAILANAKANRRKNTLERNNRVRSGRALMGYLGR